MSIGTRILGVAAAISLLSSSALAVTITYVNTGPADSRVFVGFDNDASGNLTSDFVSHTNAFSRFDSVAGPVPPPFTAQAISSAELGTDLNNPVGTGVRSVFTPFNPITFYASGTTIAAAGSYSAHSYAHSGNTTSTTPDVWIIHVDPSGAEVPGTPTDVTIDASIDGNVTVTSGTAVADASWNVTTTTHGTVISGTANQPGVGTTPFSDANILNFTIPLGSTFELLVDYDLSTSGSGASADSRSEVVASLIEISAAIATPMVAPITGAKLLLIDKYTASGKAKAVAIMKDTTPGAIAKGSSADPPQLSGTVEIYQLADPSNRAVYDLDASGWIKNKDKIAKYKNTAAAPGGPGVKTASVKPDKLIKVVAKNLGDGDTASGDQDASDLDLTVLTGTDSLVVVTTVINQVDLETHVTCAQFDALQIKQIAGGTGIKVLSKTSPVLATCP